MFGLMKARTCSLVDEFKLHRRLHYCGTCKTLGRLYGHQSRMLLNHDTVFLAEILSAISSSESDLKTWNRAYHSFNCLALPAGVTTLPLPLQIAATATVVLAQFKIADQITDSKRFIWKTAHRIFSKDFREAHARLRTWQFPFDELQKVLLSQETREASALNAKQSADDILNDLAEPTAIATAMFCSHGARLVGKPEVAPPLYALGYRFGKLIYLLDAFEDYEKDRRRGEFNAICAAYQLMNSEPNAHLQAQAGNAKMPDQVYLEVKRNLRTLAGELASIIYTLPLSEAVAEMFAERLRSNLSRKIGALPVVQHSGKGQAQACKSKVSLKARARRAIDLGKKLATRHQVEHHTSLASRLAAPLVFASVLLIAFLNPQQAGTANSFRECLSLGFNLMFFGAAINTTGVIFNSLFLLPLTRRQEPADSCQPFNDNLKNRQRPKRRPGKSVLPVAMAETPASVAARAAMPPNLAGGQPVTELNQAASQLTDKRRPKNPQEGGCCSDCFGGCCEGGWDCGCECCCDKCDCCCCDGN